MSKGFIKVKEDKELPHTIYLFGETFREYDPGKLVDDLNIWCEGNEPMSDIMNSCGDKLLNFDEKVKDAQFTMITDAEFDEPRSKWEFLICITS